MKKPIETVKLSPDELLRDSRRQATSLALPLVIHHRLDVLAEQASALSASRADVIGALIAAAEIDPDAIENLVLAYKKQTVGEAMPRPPQVDHEPPDHHDDDVVVPIRKAGRPAHKAAG